MNVGVARGELPVGSKCHPLIRSFLDSSRDPPRQSHDLFVTHEMLQAIFIAEELAIRQGHESSRSYDAVLQKDNINTEVEFSLAVSAGHRCVFIVFHARVKRKLVKKNRPILRAIRVSEIRRAKTK